MSEPKGPNEEAQAAFDELLFGKDEDESPEELEKERKRYEEAERLGDETFRTICELGHKLADTTGRCCSFSMRWLGPNKDHEMEMGGGFIPERPGNPIHADVVRALLRFGLSDPAHMSQLVDTIDKMRKEEGLA